MNPNHDLERRLAEHYAAESALRAPDRVLASAISAIESEPQRRGIARSLPRLDGVRTYARLAAASLLVVAATAFVLGVLYAGPGDVGQRPTHSPVPASPTPRPNEQGSGNFAVPFTYVLPAEANFDYGTRGQTYFEIRVPAAAEAGHPAGVIVQVIGGGRVNPCDPGSPALPLDPGPTAVIEYLKTVPDLTVTDESVASVGDLSALQARVMAHRETPACQNLQPWVETTEDFGDIPRESVVRIVAVDVGEHVVFTVFGEDSNPGWAEMADELIDSFRFGEPDRGELDRLRLRTLTPAQRSPAPP